MSIRVDPQANAELTEAIQAGSMSSGARVFEDTLRPPPWETGPWAGRQEYLASEALQLAAIPSEVIQSIKPPVPQVLFPDPQVFDRTQLTIEGALDTDRWSPTVRSYTSGSSRVVGNKPLTDDMWSGTVRNVSSSVNPAG